jgi:predicted ester cyclase
MGSAPHCLELGWGVIVNVTQNTIQGGKVDMSHTTPAVDVRELAKRSFRAIEHPGSEDLVELVHPEFRNWEAVGPAADLRGTDALSAAVEMLNHAFSELRYEVMELIAERDLAAVRTVMHGVHTGPIRAVAPTGKRFAVSQSHWFQAVDGRLAEHWATRDDLGFLHQIGAAPAARVGAEATGAAK